MTEPRPKKTLPANSVTSVGEAKTEGAPLTAVQEAIQSIRYGVVQIIIQDGRIIQIDKTEKIRLI